MLTIALAALVAALTGRASGGWDPLGWRAPGGRFWMRVWAAALGVAVALTQPVPWWLGVAVAVLAYLSRVEQTRWLETCWRTSGAAMMGVIGVLQAAAVVVPVAAWTLDPWLLPWVAVGLVRGALYFACQWLPALGPGRSIIDAPTAWAELGWYASLGALATL